jgi:2-keto-4-pentenoate hydratase/2-oxohepta-3-ene-1,7-dioic acid hydratase in catechol pathway
MKYVRFSQDDTVMFGLIDNDGVIKRLKNNFLEGVQEEGNEYYKIENVDLLPPVERPSQIIAIGLNYAGHAAESKKDIPKEAMMFMVSPSAVLGDQCTIKIPFLEHRVDYEAELAVVIGKEASQVKKADALDYIFGYTCANDISDRTLQKNDGQFTRAKSYATFKPIGPVIETEISPNNLSIKLRLNGELMQNSNTNDLIHDIESLIEQVTQVMTLYPGDIILTGTPQGVGPIAPGDEVSVEIEGIGILSNYVQAVGY